MSLRERALFLAMDRPKRTDTDELATMLDDLLSFIHSAKTPRELLSRWTAVLGYLNKHSRADVRRVAGE